MFNKLVLTYQYKLLDYLLCIKSYFAVIAHGPIGQNSGLRYSYSCKFCSRVTDVSCFGIHGQSSALMLAMAKLSLHQADIAVNLLGKTGEASEEGLLQLFLHFYLRSKRACACILYENLYSPSKRGGQQTISSAVQLLLYVLKTCPSRKTVTRWILISVFFYNVISGNKYGYRDSVVSHALPSRLREQRC